ALEKLRVAFVSDSDTPLPLDVKIRVVNLTDTPCDDEFISTPTFCLDNTDALCSPLQFTFKSQTLSNLENEESRQEINNLITWLALLHGSVLSFCMPDNHNLPDSEDKRFELKLTIENWPCNPSLSSTQCVLLELLSWIKTYSEYGGESHIMTWDQSQRGSVTIDHRYNDESDSENTLKLFWWSLSNQNFFRLGLAEYVVLSVTLALVIIRFFPAVHKQIVSRITTAERKSIYWGTFAVCNFSV
ncbi:hypothetical protein GBAR_LOCUS13183, partial [Geodia barretti]